MMIPVMSKTKKQTKPTANTSPPARLHKARNKMRIDELLAIQGLALPLARAMIMAGQVYVDEQKVASPAQLVAPAANIDVRKRKLYASRAGKKIEIACAALSISVCGKSILDIGSSTGGFTDYCLQHGAKQVTAVDVGTAQLAWPLRQDQRVKSFEKTDIRNLAPEYYHDIDLVLADVSFISLTTILPTVFAQLKQAEYLVLIKPQFEIPRRFVPRGGIITNSRHRRYALDRVKEIFQQHGFTELEFISSSVLGTKGNQEFFLYAR